MRKPDQKFEYLCNIKSADAFFLLIGIEAAHKKGFDIHGCNIDLSLEENIYSTERTYIVSFYPQDLTSIDIMDYEMKYDDFNVYIDSITHEVIRACPSR